jgi:hypothetical protein
MSRRRSRSFTVSRPRRGSHLTSVRVNGHDVEPGADEREGFVFACRVYRTPLGLSEQPSPEWVRAALAPRV